MANKRILDETTASVAASDDYLYIDGATNGSRKITPENIVLNSTTAQLLTQHIADATQEVGEIEDDIADLKSDLGDLTDLDTTDKSSIVNAINEVAGGSGSGLTADIKTALLQIAQKVAYIDEDGQDYYDDLYDALYDVTAISVTPTSVTLQTIGGTQQLTATTTPSGASVTWSSSNTSVATVSSTGLVTSVAYGSATITATAGSVSATCSVVVAQATCTGITATYTQSGTVYDTDSLDSLKTDLVVTASWSNSTTTTLASTDYTLSGTLAEGTSTVTVSYAGQTDTFSVTVTASGVTNPYHADDMVLWLDGIYNKSTGHDSSATTWEDLIGNISFANTGITVDSDCMVFDGTSGHGFLGTAPNSPKTIEIVLSVDNSSTTQVVINGFGNSAAGNVCVKGGSLLEKRGNYQSLGKNCQAISNGTHTYTFIDGVGQYIDGVSASVTTQNSSWANSGAMAIGNAIAGSGTLATGSAGYPLTGKIHCIRFYSDELTSTEIASNAAVDATRFNIS